MTTEYSFTTEYQQARRGVPAAYFPEIIKDGETVFTGPRFATEQDAATWAGRYIAAKAASLIQPARCQQTAPTATPVVAPAARVPRVHKQAQSVASIMGLPAPRATNGCYYCGVPLVNGSCEDCG